MSPRIVNKIEKRNAILRKAMEVFAERGFYDFKMIDIARAAGVGKGTLYEYFKSKTELIEGCTELFMAEYSRELHEHLSQFKHPDEQVYELISTTLGFFTSDPNRLKLIFDFWVFTYRSKERAEKMIKMLDSFSPILTSLIEIIQRGMDEGGFKKGDPRTIALSLMAVMDGLLFYLAMGLIDVNEKELAKNVSRTFLEGILA